jgi:hypothetical protein
VRTSSLLSPGARARALPPPHLSPLPYKTDAKRSAVGAALAAAVALPWAAAFTLGGPRLVGQSLFDRWNVAGFDLDAWGLRF